MTEHIPFSDLNGSSSTIAAAPEEKKESGCRVTVVKGFILTFLALVLVVLVAVIVHFVGRGSASVTCECQYPPPVSEESQWEECLRLSAKRNECLSAPHCPGMGMTTALTTSPDPPTTAAPTPYPNVRLPLKVNPLHYDLELTPNIYTGDPTTFNFSGNVKVKVQDREPTDVITMQINKLVVGDVMVEADAARSKANMVKEVKRDEEKQFLLIHLNSMLEAGKNYTVTISFSSQLKDDLVGLYWSSYNVNGVTKYLATTQMQPTDARKTFPCFDEPGVKSTFSVTLLRKKTMKSLTNMNMVSEGQARPGDWVADVYAQSPKMPTYLLAFIICDFNYTEMTTKSGVKFRVWSRPEAVDQTTYALEKGVETLEYFEEYFNIPFPLPKQDMIAVPDFAAGAMENWGLIIYRETALLFDSQLSSESNKRRVAEVVVHELAHQWFGNLVTPVWWDDLWLNEGFASYMEYVGMEEIEPSWNVHDQFVERDLQYVFLIDSLSSSHPIWVPVGHPDEINEIFDRISYLKGASIIRMMNSFLGESTFTAGLTNYLNAYAFGNSNHTDLWHYLGQQAKADGQTIDVSAVMNTWVRQMGYPLVTISVTGSTASVTQEHYLTDPSKPPSDKYPSPYDYKWYIPLSYTQSSTTNWANPKFTWINPSDQSMLMNLDTSAKWLIGNVGFYGYYRVNYDMDNWNALIVQMNEDHTVIPVKNRAQIVDDAVNLGRSGHLDQLVGLRATEYLVKETDYIPWKAASDVLLYFDRMLRYTEYYGAYEGYLLKQVKPLYDSVGYDYDQDTEPHLEKYKRSLAWAIACGNGEQSCLNQATSALQQWMNNPDDDLLIKPDMKDVIYCNAIRNGGVAEWNFLYGKYKTANVAAEADRILSALACSKQPWVLNRFMDYALDPNEIRKQDGIYVIRDVSLGSVGRNLAWDFFRENWGKIQEIWGSGFFAISNLISGLTLTFNTPFLLEQMQEFQAQNPDLGAGTRAFEQALESVQANIKWMDANKDKLGTWLIDQTAAPTVAPTPYPDVRLPLKVTPTHYDLELAPDIYTDDPANFTFSGKVEITVQCLESTDVITLHINKLTIDGAIELLDSGPSARVPMVDRYSIDEERQFLLIHLNGMLTVGMNYTFKINFHGPLKNDLAGIYWSSYTAEGQTKYLATSQLQPTDARKTFPCFDEPGIKSTYSTTLLRKPHLTSITNMDIVTAGEPRQDGWVADIYAKSPAMPTYLLAFVVCDFEYREGTTKNGVKFRVWSRPEAINQTYYALDKGIETLDYFEDYFNIRFPLPKQDMIAVPDFAAGAMENWGLIIYRETALLYDVQQSSESNKRRVAEVVVHELAHQWFGNLVTPVWWDDLWLNEGFASYMEYVGMEVIEPSWNVHDQFVERDLQLVFLIDSLSTSHPIWVPVSHPDEINEIFDRISYLKGASIIRMMNFFLGESTFTAGLTNYLNAFAFGNSNHTDLWNYLGMQAIADGQTIDVSAVMNTWVRQMGYPLVTISVTGSTASVTQEHYLTDPSKPPSDKYPSPYGYKWNIPLAYTQNTATDGWTKPTLDWFMTDEDNKQLTNLDANADWTIGNVGFYGYYRVNYDEQNWNALIDQLINSHTVIPVKNRAQIIDDAMNLGRSGHLDQLVGLKATEYLVSEQDYIPWKAASDVLLYVDRMLRYTEYYGAYEAYVRKQVKPLYDLAGFDYNQETEPHLDRYRRSLAWALACGNGEQTCLDEATASLRQWMDDPDDDTLIKPDMKDVIYCNGIRNGGVEEWNFLYQKYKTANVASEAARILDALTCSKEPWILNRFMEYALDGNEIRKQDGIYVIRDVSLGTVGRTLAWDFFRANWDTIGEIWGSGSFALSNLVSGMTVSFNTQFLLDQMNEFRSQNSNLGAGSRAFDQAVESTQANIKWMATNKDKLGQWLMEQS